MLNIVLYQPEIPQNTGNIGRSCVLTGSRLHLIKPLGFEITDKQIRRTGLDYWQELDLVIHESFEDFLLSCPGVRIHAITTKGDRCYHEVAYEDGDYLLFGRESSGLPDEVREALTGHLVRVPMVTGSTRSLNLSNTAALVLYEALRGLGFPGME